MILRFASVLALVLAALSLGPSFAHLLEAPPRLHDWPPQLWIETTVRHGQFALFRIVGAPIDILAIVAAAALAWVLRGKAGFWPAATGAVLLLLALGAWFAMVAPANTILASWHAGAQPTDFIAVRGRWENGHRVAAVLKACGFVALALAATARGRRTYDI